MPTIWCSANPVIHSFLPIREEFQVLKIGMFFIAALIIGCSASRMPALNQYEAQYAPWSSAESVSSVLFEREGFGGNLPACVAVVVNNTGETLTDSSNSFFGAYSGKYYNIENSVHVGGGDVLQYVSPDSRSVVASGISRYEAGALVTRSVRFKLSVRQSDSGRQYSFSNLAQAQLNSGTAANTGYGPIGSWSSANPDLALQSLDSVVDEIEKCLGHR